MKIVFIGSVIFSNLILEKIIMSNIDIIGVVSLKYKKKLFKSDYYDLKKTCKKNNLFNFTTQNINNKKSITFIKKLNPDLILCVGWSQKISEEILKIPKLGTIGYHPSKLPENRGKHPIIWSLVLGLKKTASTFFLMDKKIDNGNILSQKIINIETNDNATSLYFKLCKSAEKQVLDLIKKIEKNKKFVFIKKNIGKVNYWRSRDFKDGEINWSSSSQTINNLVKSLAFPYPNAHFYYKNQIIKVSKTKLGVNKNKTIEFGKIISTRKNMYEVKCGQYSIYLLDFYPKIKMKIGEYL